MRRLLFIFVCALCFGLSLPLFGARGDDGDLLAFRLDTLSVRLAFAPGETDVDLAYGGNGEAWEAFLETWRRELSGGNVEPYAVLICTGVTLDGSPSFEQLNKRVKAQALRSFVQERLDVDVPFRHVDADADNWQLFGAAVRASSFAWKDAVVSVLDAGAEVPFEGARDGRISQLRSMYGGNAWAWLMDNVYPSLSETRVSVVLKVTRPVSAAVTLHRGSLVVRDTVWRTRIVRDTVLVEDLGYDYKFTQRVRDKRFLGAVRTNILAVPLANVGVELPFGRHWSVGLDLYYPWIWRNSLHKDCTEMMAYGLDVRFWPGRDRDPVEARLLGHSFGVYAAGGHYDFERDWVGHQGNFWNVGFDWMYGVPLFHGKMHLEFEVGLGMIWSVAQPYECFFEYGDCIRQTGVTKVIRWFGPTRAQISVVVPIYVEKRRGVGR